MGTNEPKRRRGRPPGTGKPPEEKVVERKVCHRPDQTEIVEAIKAKYGLSAWFQQQLDKARL